MLDTVIVIVVIGFFVIVVVVQIRCAVGYPTHMTTLTANIRFIQGRLQIMVVFFRETQVSFPYKENPGWAKHISYSIASNNIKMNNKHHHHHHHCLGPLWWEEPNSMLHPRHTCSFRDTYWKPDKPSMNSVYNFTTTFMTTTTQLQTLLSPRFDKPSPKHCNPRMNSNFSSMRFHPSVHCLTGTHLW